LGGRILFTSEAVLFRWEEAFHLRRSDVVYVGSVVVPDNNRRRIWWRKRLLGLWWLIEGGGCTVGGRLFCSAMLFGWVEEAGRVVEAVRRQGMERRFCARTVTWGVGDMYRLFRRLLGCGGYVMMMITFLFDFRHTITILTSSITSYVMRPQMCIFFQKKRKLNLNFEFDFPLRVR
jgi:hypothetical protein